jgi:hypothetical protein
MLSWMIGNREKSSSLKKYSLVKWQPFLNGLYVSLCFVNWYPSSTNLFFSTQNHYILVFLAFKPIWILQSSIGRTHRVKNVREIVKENKNHERRRRRGGIQLRDAVCADL